MTVRIRHLLVLCVALAAFAFPAAGHADPDAVVRDCAADGSVDGDYSDADKRAALNRIPADLDEYSDCRSLIGASIGGGAKGKKAGAIRDSGDGPGPAAARKRPKRTRAATAKSRREATEAALGDRVVDPGSAEPLETSHTDNGISLPVLLALIALGLLLAAGSVMALARRNGGLPGPFRRVGFARLRR